MSEAKDSITINPTPTSQRTVAYNAIAALRDVVLASVPHAQREKVQELFEQNASVIISCIRDIADERDSLVGLLSAAAIAEHTQKVVQG